MSGGSTINHDWPLNRQRADRAGDTIGLHGARSHHPGGVHAIFTDGHVQFVKDTVSVPTWRALATRAGGEVVGSDQF